MLRNIGKNRNGVTVLLLKNSLRNISLKHQEAVEDLDVKYAVSLNKKLILLILHRLLKSRLIIRSGKLPVLVQMEHLVYLHKDILAKQRQKKALKPRKKLCGQILKYYLTIRAA